MTESNIEGAIRYSNRIFEACLFELSYTSDIYLYLTEGISYPPYKRPFSLKKRVSFEEKRDVPKVTYNSDLIRFYQRGVGTIIPSLKFLAFYQVLEYFYEKVSNENLYHKISSIINDPLFKSTSSTSFDKLIQEIEGHKKITNERKKLTLVLTKYINENELIQFLKSYEEFLGKKYLNKQKDIFGVKISLNLTPGYVFGNVGKLIKTIRNALVHSSDCYERQERHIPFSESTEIVKREIPLVKFLAEKVIIRSASIESLKV